MATALLLRCELVVYSDFLEVGRVGGSIAGVRAELKLDFQSQLVAYSNLVELARDSKLPRQEVEGYIYYAQFCGFARTFATEYENTPPP
ncbi:hypothetical protein NKR19_g7611 [Coniochaeta hoffmannii]|uniref:Uncharacterized protein n=1 Tax=Coniochaeta hoffmannii TaxID=91930 RepID=A0AA38RJP4_9PEZI|nr:hypothetical protein NKR19_g7611 [Coniochaeta hoffmannii]